MNNVRTIYLDWYNGSIRATGGSQLAYQYDHLSNLVIFENAPKLDNYYLIVEMKETEDGGVRTFEPIQLAGSFWLIPNSYTQLAQNISFQVCCKTPSGDFERHSAQFTGTILPSKDHAGAELDVDPSIMYDPYKQWVSDIAMAAGAIVIDPTLSVQGAAADAKATGDAIAEVNERLTELESGSRGGLTDTQKELIITILRNAIYTSDQSKNIDELEDAFANTVISISATLDLRENTIYSDDTLDTLRQYLTVRATYDDGTTQTITGYALSGTLTVGTSTIQVIYRDATASVNVPVSQAVVRYTVTNNLTGVTNSNTDTTIAESNTYTGILTAETTGYIPINVSVTVGGTDVTSTAYDSSTHTITITNVQGNIVIVASEGEDPYAPKFELTSPLIVGDTTDPRINDTANNRIATGVTVNDNENWTVCVDFTSLLDGAVQGASILRNDNNQFTVIYNTPNWNAAWHGSNTVIKNDYSGGKWRGLNFVAIITHESNTLSVNVYGTVTNTITKASIATASNGQVYIGSTYQMGTINRLAIYKRVLTADEITAWIGE